MDKVELETKYKGTLVATREGEAIGLSLPLGGPAQPSHDAELRHSAACAAGITVADIEEVATYPDANGLSAVYRVKASVNLKGRNVDVPELGKKIPGYNIFTQVVGKKDGEVKINSRVFVPFAGIDEDPVVSVGIGLADGRLDLLMLYCRNTTCLELARRPLVMFRAR